MSPGGRSGTFWEFHRIMRGLHEQGRRPPLIVLENVVGLLSGPDFPALCEAMAALDMRLGAVVMDAVHFLPQSRPRVFVVALDDRVDPGPWELQFGDRPIWTTASLERAFGELAPAMQARWVRWNVPAPEAVVPAVESLIDDAPSGVEWHTPAETERLLTSMTAINREKVERALAGDGRHVGFIYKRTRAGQVRAEVRFDGVAGCLRTATGGSSRQTVIVVEDGAVRSRLLSTREAARLMGLPESFVLPANYNEAYHAMGDGVAVPVVSWLAETLLTPVAHSLELQQPRFTPFPDRKDSAALQRALLESNANYELAGD